MSGEAADPAAVLLVQLGRLVRLLRQESAGAPIGASGLSALFTLSGREDGLRLGELAETEGVSAPSLTRIVNALEEEGLVARTPDPHDGRALRVALTAAGTRLIASGQHARLAALRRRFDALDAEQQRLLEAALPALDALVGGPTEERRAPTGAAHRATTSETGSTG